MFNFFKKINKNEKACPVKPWHSRGFSRLVDFRDAISSRTKSASRKFTTGFSLIEILIVSGIILIIAVAGIGFYANYGKSVDLSSFSETMSFDIKQAQTKSMSGDGGLKYGIHFVNSTQDYYEIFSTPTDYSNGAKVIISSIYLPGSISFSTPGSGATKDVIFDKISGKTTADSVGLLAGSSTKTINISALGIVSIQ